MCDREFFSESHQLDRIRFVSFHLILFRLCGVLLKLCKVCLYVVVYLGKKQRELSVRTTAKKASEQLFKAMFLFFDFFEFNFMIINEAFSYFQALHGIISLISSK